MNKNPLVSLITPGWNGVSFVHRLLDSILSQTYDNIEYIYVDDGSTDGTSEVVKAYENKFIKRGYRFKYISKANGGVSSAINEGLKYVTGKYLGWPEYDDILNNDSIKLRVSYLETHPDCAVVTCDAWLVNENEMDKPFGLLSKKNPNRFDKNHFVQALLTNSIFTAACHLIRMDAFDKTHKDRTIYQSWIGPNWQMLLPLYYDYNRGFIDKPLVKYLVRPDSISHSHTTLDKQLIAIEEYKRILNYVLDEIKMSDDDRILYKSLIIEHYAYDWCNLGFKYNNKELFEKGLNVLLENGFDINKDLKIKQQVLNNYLFKVIYKIVNSLQRRLIYDNC